MRRRGVVCAVVLVALGMSGAAWAHGRAGLLEAAAAPLFGSFPARCAPTGPPRGGEMVYVPEGAFLRGSRDAGQSIYAGLPLGRVDMSAFWIDKTEVTVAAYGECVEAGACSAPSTTQEPHCNAERYVMHPWLHRASSGAYPVDCVTWAQAVTYCTWAQKCLPTEAQWEKAARGTDGRPYPWGFEAPAGFNTHGNFADPPDPEAGEPPPSHFGSPVGSYPLGASPYGALDMSGNVWEWTQDWYAPTCPVAEVRDPQGPASGVWKVVRGGRYVGPDAPPAEVSERGQYSLAEVIVGVGFRCARPAFDEP